MQTADEAQIRDHVGTGLTIFRFAPDPRILVLDFASLYQQGRMLDRIAAMMEKEDVSHDRVLTDAELDKVIRRGGDTVATYYYGHDYSAAELVRFFTLADQEHIRLYPEEETLRRLLHQLGWFRPGAQGALISIPQPGANKQVTLAARSAILRHELSHGQFFSDPAYASFVQHFWQTALTPQERHRFIAFLASEEYDTSLHELVINEMQAYLMFTRNPAFFTPAMIDMTPGRLNELQAAFAHEMPRGWLRDKLLSEQPIVPAAAH